MSWASLTSIASTRPSAANPMGQDERQESHPHSLHLKLLIQAEDQGGRGGFLQRGETTDPFSVIRRAMTGELFG